MTDAYIAGFFDGEGCVAAKRQRGPKRRIYLRIGQKHPEVLHLIQTELGYGSVHQRRDGLHILNITGRKNTTDFIQRILPYAVVKRSQLHIALAMNGCIGVTDTIENRDQLYEMLKKAR